MARDMGSGYVSTRAQEHSSMGTLGENKKNNSSFECNRRYGASIFSVFCKFCDNGNETDWMGVMRNISFLITLLFGIELCAKCSSVPEPIRNKYASDMFTAFVTQSQGKSTVAFFQFDVAREQAKKAGENILNLIAIEKLFVWYRIYGTSLRLFYKNPTGTDYINGEYKSYSQKLSVSRNCQLEWSNNPEQSRLIREFMFGVGEVISGVFCAAVTGPTPFGYFSGGVALDGGCRIFTSLNSLWAQHQAALIALKEWEQTSLKPTLE